MLDNLDLTECSLKEVKRLLALAIQARQLQDATALQAEVWRRESQ